MTCTLVRDDCWMSERTLVWSFYFLQRESSNAKLRDSSAFFLFCSRSATANASPVLSPKGCQHQTVAGAMMVGAGRTCDGRMVGVLR